MVYLFIYFSVGFCCNLIAVTNTDDIPPSTSSTSLVANETKTATYHFEIVPLEVIECKDKKLCSLPDKDRHELQKKLIGLGAPLYLEFAARFNELGEKDNQQLNIVEPTKALIIEKEKKDLIKHLATFIDYKELRTVFYTVLENLKHEPFMLNQEPYWLVGGILNGIPKSSYWLASLTATEISSHLPKGLIHCIEGNFLANLGQKFFDNSNHPLHTINIVMIEDIHYSGAQLEDTIAGILRLLGKHYDQSVLSGKTTKKPSKIKVNFFMYSLLIHPQAIERASRVYGYESQNNPALALIEKNIDVSIIIKHTKKDSLRSAKILITENILTEEEFTALGFHEEQALTIPVWKSPDELAMNPNLPNICDIRPCDDKHKPYYVDLRATSN